MSSEPVGSVDDDARIGGRWIDAKSIAGLASIGAGAIHAAAAGGHAVHWSYEGQGGPAQWGAMKPEFANFRIDEIFRCFPAARFALKGIPSAEELPAVGASLSTTLSGTLLLHGAEHPLAVPVRVTREAAGRIRVRNSKPVVLSVKDLGMEQPLAVLKAVCGHESVSGAVPIEIDVLFTPI